MPATVRPAFAQATTRDVGSSSDADIWDVRGNALKPAFGAANPGVSIIRLAALVRVPGPNAMGDIRLASIDLPRIHSPCLAVRGPVIRLAGPSGVSTHAVEATRDMGAGRIAVRGRHTPIIDPRPATAPAKGPLHLSRLHHGRPERLLVIPRAGPQAGPTRADRP